MIFKVKNKFSTAAEAVAFGEALLKQFVSDRVGPVVNIVNFPATQMPDVLERLGEVNDDWAVRVRSRGAGHPVKPKLAALLRGQDDKIVLSLGGLQSLVYQRGVDSRWSLTLRFFASHTDRNKPIDFEQLLPVEDRLQVIDTLLYRLGVVLGVEPENGSSRRLLHEMGSSIRNERWHLRGEVWDMETRSHLAVKVTFVEAPPAAGLILNIAESLGPVREWELETFGSKEHALAVMKASEEELSTVSTGETRAAMRELAGATAKAARLWHAKRALPVADATEIANNIYAERVNVGWRAITWQFGELTARGEWGDTLDVVREGENRPAEVFLGIESNNYTKKLKKLVEGEIGIPLVGPF